MKDHAKLSPSAASRWLNCTASPTMEAKYPTVSTSYANEGTFAHSLAELCARYALGEINKRTYNSRLKKMIKGDTEGFYNQEMQDHCEEYATYIKEKYFELKEECPDAFVELEVKLDLSTIIPEGFGTADCIIVAEPKVWIVDFKYGKGIKVEAEGNVQMEIYGLGVMERYGALFHVRRVGMTIVQPRLGGISETDIDADALRAWGTIHIKPLAKAAYDGPGYFRPSEETCRFCKARQDCRARAEYFLRLFEESDDADMLTADEAGKILEKAAGIEEWLKDIKEKVTSTLFAGDPVQGWKLVEGKSNRKFTDEKEVAAILESESDLDHDEIWITKLAGITSLEKNLGKKKFEELLGKYVIKPEGKPTLASADDKRPEIFPAEQIVNAFDE